MNTIVLTGGGTAGHVTPNIALIPYLNGYEIHYCGEEGGIEQQMLTRYPQVIFHPLPCIKFSRSLSPKNLSVPFILGSGIRKAKKLFAEINPKVVFSKGGYAALPAAMAAAKKKIPLVIHESDTSMGLSNRLVARKCRHVCASYPQVADSYPNGFLTGAILRRELYFGKKENVIKKFGMPQNGKPNLLVFGGSIGAVAINKALESALHEICTYFNVLHISGKHDYTGGEPNYRRLEFCDCMQDCYAWADIIVCRAGANTLCEVTALRKPALVIPLPKSKSSRGDQVLNAQYYADLGAIKILPQEKLTCGELVTSTLSLYRDRTSYIAAMEKAPSPDGTRKIASLLNSFNVNSLPTPTE